MRQERVALAQRLQLLALTQRGPCAVLGAQRGLGRCWAGTYTHTHTERDMPLEGAHGLARAQGEPWGLRTTFRPWTCSTGSRTEGTSKLQSRD